MSAAASVFAEPLLKTNQMNSKIFSCVVSLLLCSVPSPLMAVPESGEVLGKAGATSSAAPGKPNIIFILFDDMGYGQPPCYRAGSEFKTPDLDRLAQEGMRFTDAHTACIGHWRLGMKWDVPNNDKKEKAAPIGAVASMSSLATPMPGTSA